MTAPEKHKQRKQERQRTEGPATFFKPGDDACVGSGGPHVIFYSQCSGKHFATGRTL
jgi:hypothetical protein